MSFFVAAVILVGLLCTLDLLLTLGMIKRLREHTRQLASRPTDRSLRPSLVVGEEVGDFRVIAQNGEELTPDRIPDGSVVAFFSPTCEPCKEKVPMFAAHARAVPMGSRQVIAVVVGDSAEAEHFSALLAPVASVVVEGPDGALTSAFRARAFPTILEVGHDQDGRLVVTSEEPALTDVSSSSASSLA
ncbi:TlpA family protein disulfide reductase [Streptomyces sp. NPDC088246]|uniref:TlpA family protein disulfide reductase n=1 Tax=Streptomyces sp. NPDC088246 TaxID=3365842 RepID=UPI003830F152